MDGYKRLVLHRVWNFTKGSVTSPAQDTGGSFMEREKWTPLH